MSARLTKAQRAALAECAKSNHARILYWWRPRTMESLRALGLVDTWTPPSVAERPRLKRRPWIITPAGREALKGME